MHPRGHELVHIRSMNWVQSTFITCHAFLFFARTSRDILGHMTVSSTTLHCHRLRGPTGTQRATSPGPLGAGHRSVTVHERSWSMTRPNREKHHETCQETSPTCHTSTLDMRRVGTRMRHQCPRDRDRPLSHQSTASASPEMLPSSQVASPVPARP